MKPKIPIILSAVSLMAFCTTGEESTDQASRATTRTAHAVEPAFSDARA